MVTAASPAGAQVQRSPEVDRAQATDRVPAAGDRRAVLVRRNLLLGHLHRQPVRLSERRRLHARRRPSRAHVPNRGLLHQGRRKLHGHWPQLLLDGHLRRHVRMIYS